MLSYFIKGAPRSASKLSIDPISSHASYIGKSTGSNKRSVPINRTVSYNWNQGVNQLNKALQPKQRKPLLYILGCQRHFLDEPVLMAFPNNFLIGSNVYFKLESRLIPECNEHSADNVCRNDVWIIQSPSHFPQVFPQFCLHIFAVLFLLNSVQIVQKFGPHENPVRKAHSL